MLVKRYTNQFLVSSIISVVFASQVVAMEGKWTNNSFVATETRLLFDLIKLIHRKNSLDW